MREFVKVLGIVIILLLVWWILVNGCTCREGLGGGGLGVINEIGWQGRNESTCWEHDGGVYCSVIGDVRT